MTRICFVRHGETDWNTELRMQGHTDRGLNTIGERQAAAVAERLAGVQAAALYSSDLLRARQTARPLAQALGLPMTLLPALRERHFGRCEGRTFAEIVAQSEEDARALESRDPDYASPGGGESRRQHQQRVLDCLAGLVSDHRGQTIVIVTHGGVLDVIYRRALGMPPDAPREHAIPNAGINWVAINGAQWVVECWADAAHLG